METEQAAILLIGMDKEKYGILEEIFKDAEYNLSAAPSGEMTLDYISSICADCIIIDYDLWSNNLYAAINSGLSESGKNIPVIVSRNKYNYRSMEESFRKGADDFITFPFRHNEVIARVKNQIFKSRSGKDLEEEVEKRTSDLKKTNMLLNQSVEEYRNILQDLQENETLMLAIALNIPNSYLAIIEKNYTISFAAGQEFKKINLDPWRLIGLPIEKILKDQSDYVKNYFVKTFEGHETSFELEINSQYLLYKGVPLFNSNGSVPRILVVAENISERKISDRRIKESLHEKETLLKEIHHRVKNNMQLVCSMINLQAESINNNEVSYIFKMLQSRIYSMSLVHEKLYHHEQFSKINFSEYVKELVSEISNSFSKSYDESGIKIELKLQDENFTIDKAIPCGLILNELIMNAFKYASFKSGEGRIKIVFEKLGNDCYKLIVSDNGKGLPEGFDINSSDSMGMTLVRELVSQLRGTITVESGVETVFTIVFGEMPQITEEHPFEILSDSNKNILVVEDERIIARMLRKILEERGYNIVNSVASGKEAIESAARYNPDLIIMDIMLEDDIDGVEAAAVIMENHACPIIFLTGNSDPATLKSARDINPFEMLTKPVEKFHLIEVIESAFK